MTQDTKFNPAAWIPYLAAAAQVVQFTNAGFTLFGWRGFICGLFLGLLVSVSVAYSASQYSISWPREKRVLSLVSMAFLLAFSPVVVGSAAYLDLPVERLGGWAIVLAAAWGVLPDFAVFVSGVSAGRAFAKQEKKQGENRPETNENKPQARSASNNRKKNKEHSKKPYNTFTDEQLAALIAKHPGASNVVLGRLLGVSGEAVRLRRPIDVTEQVRK